MKTLYFSVSGQKLKTVRIPDDLIKGTKRYLQCEFSFDGQDWSGCKVVAEFNEKYAAPVKNRICMVPDEAAARQYFKLRLIGVKDDYQIVTNNVIIKQGVI